MICLVGEGMIVVDIGNFHYRAVTGIFLMSLCINYYFTILWQEKCIGTLAWNFIIPWTLDSHWVSDPPSRVPNEDEPY